MQELIDRQAALEKMCGDCKSGYDGHCPHPCGMCHEYESILQAPTIDSEPVRHGRWIPVEDALPEKAGNYLCTLFYTIPPYNLFHPEKDTYIRETSVKFFDGKSFIASVVAWMPMPDAYEPPESEVQEDAET